MAIKGLRADAGSGRYDKDVNSPQDTKQCSEATPSTSHSKYIASTSDSEESTTRGLDWETARRMAMRVMGGGSWELCL